MTSRGADQPGCATSARSCSPYLEGLAETGIVGLPLLLTPRLAGAALLCGAGPITRELGVALAAPAVIAVHIAGD